MTLTRESKAFAVGMIETWLREVHESTTANDVNAMQIINDALHRLIDQIEKS